MSILIKGAMPPSGCAFCYFNEDSKCALIPGCNYDETNGWKRRDDCPLIELPGHGDLIERDELMKHEVYIPRDGGNLPVVYMSYVKAAKTVIPAERSEK